MVPLRLHFFQWVDQVKCVKRYWILINHIFMIQICNTFPSTITIMHKNLCLERLLDDWHLQKLIYTKSKIMTLENMSRPKLVFPRLSHFRSTKYLNDKTQLFETMYSVLDNCKERRSGREVGCGVNSKF